MLTVSGVRARAVLQQPQGGGRAQLAGRGHGLHGIHVQAGESVDNSYKIVYNILSVLCTMSSNRLIQQMCFLPESRYFPNEQ